jgi:glycosyltransferase involved in cell wall biosynthesis
MQKHMTPKVSVCVVTYNQENYIHKCLQSIVDQETDFDFEVIVSDDCSTDGTKEILQKFAEKYPDVVKPIFHEINLGALKNYRYVNSLANGKYVAHVDGDDSIYPGKLMKQCKFLDENENCNLVAHRMSVFEGSNRVFDTSQINGSINLTKLLLNHPMFLNSSIMYRKEKVGDVFLLDLDFIDFYVYVWAARKSDIGFINEVLGGYSRNVGISSKRNLMPFIQAAIDLAVGYVPDEIISRARSRQYLSYAVAALMAGDELHFFKHIEAAKNCQKKSYRVYVFYYLRNMQPLIRFFVNIYKKIKFVKFLPHNKIQTKR